MGNEPQTNAFNRNGGTYTTLMIQTLAQFLGYLAHRPPPLPQNLPYDGPDAALIGYPIPADFQGLPGGNPYMDTNSHITFVQEIGKILEGISSHTQEMDALKTSMEVLKSSVADISKEWKVLKEEQHNKESPLLEEVASIREALKSVEEEQQKEIVKREETKNIISKNYEELRGAIKELERYVYKNVAKNQQISEKIPPPPPSPPKENPPIEKQLKEVHVHEDYNINHDNFSSNENTWSFTRAQVAGSRKTTERTEKQTTSLIGQAYFPPAKLNRESKPLLLGYASRSKQADGRSPRSYRTQEATSPRHYHGNVNKQSERSSSVSRSRTGWRY